MTFQETIPSFERQHRAIYIWSTPAVYRAVGPLEENVVRVYF